MALTRLFVTRALLLLLCGACEEPATVVIIDVAGADLPGLVSLSATLQSSGTAIQRTTVHVIRRLDRFVARLPASTSGRVDLQLSGLGQDGCAIAVAEDSFAVAPLGQVQRSVTLRPLAAAEAGCLLRLSLLNHGAGQLTVETTSPEGEVLTALSVPLGPAAQSAVRRFSAGQRLRLRATPDAKSYFGGWTGACRGRGRCEVTLEGPPIQVGAILAAEQTCIDGRMCWENPLPVGSTLFRVHGSSERDLWAVGEHGSIFHYDGAQWLLLAGQTAPGEQTEDGAPLPALRGIWSRSADEAWAVGDRGAILRWDGAGWQKEDGDPDRSLYSVWGRGKDDLWIAGERLANKDTWTGSIWHRRGGKLALAIDGLDGIPIQIVGCDSGQAWAFGQSRDYRRGYIWHYDGSQWREELRISGALPSGWVDRRCEGWAAGVAHLGGQGSQALILHRPALAAGWSEAYRGDPRNAGAGVGLGGIWASERGEVWAVGARGLVLRRSGAAFQTVPITDFHGTLGGIFGAEDGRVWASGQGGVLMFYNGAFFQPADRAFRSQINHVHGTGPDNVWAVGNDGLVLRSDGRAWRPVIPRPGAFLTGVFSGGPRSTWVAGGRTVLYFDGDKWIDVLLGLSGGLLPDVVRAVWGHASDPLTAWVAGDGGRLTRLRLVPQGDALFVDARVYAVAPAAIHALWGDAPERIWAVGSGGAILRFDGTSFAAEQSPTGSDLFGVSGTGPSDVWAVGSGATVLHRDGARWSVVLSDPMQAINFRGVFARGPSDLWIVGDGTSIRVTPAGGPRVDNTIGESLTAIWGRGTDLWLTGPGGLLLSYRENRR